MYKTPFPNSVEVLYELIHFQLQDCDDTPRGLPNVTPIQLQFSEESDDIGEKQELHQLSIRKIRILSDDEDHVDDKSLESCSITCTLMVKTKKTTVKKEPEDTIPLPSLFPLPKYHPCIMELALKSKQMTWKTTKKFISCIAGAMLNYKCYPTSRDYSNVAQRVVNKSSHLKSPTGSPRVSLLRHIGTYLNLCKGAIVSIQKTDLKILKSKGESSLNN